MGRVGEEDSDPKSQLVTKICSIASHYSISNPPSCRTHRSTRPHFIDWYLILQVGEDAHIDIIRKQYRKLALQLHPDKNKHPKAEVAFRLVSEAYACLCDKAKRKAFDFDRCNSLCKEYCSRISLKTCNFPPEIPRSDIINHQLRQVSLVRERFREEVRVIESCLKINKASRTEFPVFNPSDYTFGDYPHYRKIYKTPEDFLSLRAGSIRNYDQRTEKCESPIFEIRPERRSLHHKSAYVSS